MDDLAASAAYTNEFGAHVAQLLLASGGKQHRSMMLEEAITGVPGRDLTWEEIVNVINEMVLKVPGYMESTYEIDRVARVVQQCQEGKITRKMFLPKECREPSTSQQDADQRTLSDPDATPRTAAPAPAACSTDEPVQVVAEAPAADSADVFVCAATDTEGSDATTLSLGHGTSPTGENEEVECMLGRVQTSIAFL